jgi:WD40 repeat protein/serine/threonine protein kinase
LWQKGQPPDPDAFLNAAGLRVPAEIAEVLAIDQWQRWHAGQRLPAEDYLARYPAIAADQAAALALVFGEFLVREELGETPTVTEYLARFPQYAEALRQQIGFHAALNEPMATLTLQTSPPEALPRPLPVVPGYEVLEELGRGGMGVVYKARQVQLNRLVALKMILAGVHADRHELARFRAEAEAVARLQHPGIVQVFEVGEHDGHPFLALEFVGGGSLAEQLSGEPWPAHRAAPLLIPLARAVQHAHQQGVIHRDLKPGNVLLAACDVTPDATPQAAVPKIADFGLAKRLDAEQQLSITGAVLGTPSYMAPEQAAGQKEIGPATDVYALGAILYECLTGRPPFRGASVYDTLLLVRNAEPVPPSHLTAGLPLDLETICLKCLRKEPPQRYGSAGELADDLERFLRDEPVHARPVGRLERGWRWCRRNPIVATLSAALLMVLLVGSLVASIAAIKYYRLANSEQQAKDEAVRKGDDLRRSLSAQYVATGTQALDADDYSLALRWFAKALELDRDDPEREWADRLRLANTWRRMPRLVGVYSHGAQVTWAEMSSDGRRVVTASYDGTARLWDVASGEPIGQPMEHPAFVFRARFSPDGRTVATACGDGTVRLWNGETGASLRPPLDHALSVYALEFSPDGQHLATGCADPSLFFGPPAGVDPRDAGRVVRTPREGKPVAAVWDLPTGTCVALPIPSHIMALAYSGDGRRLAVVTEAAGAASVFDPTTGKRVGGPFRHQGQGTNSNIVVFVSLNTRGNLLVTGTYDSQSQLWDVDSGTELISGMSGARAFVEPGDKWVVGRGLWNVATGKGDHPTGDRPPPAMGSVSDASLSATTWHILARNNDGVRIWEAGKSWNPLTPLLRTPHHQDVRLGQGSRYVLVPGLDHACRLWDVASTAPALPPLGPWGRFSRYSPDGQRVVTGDRNHAVALWDSANGRSVLTDSLRHPGPVWDAEVSPDGRLVVSAGGNGEARLWEAATGKPLLPALPHGFPVARCAFNRAGDRLVTLEAVEPLGYYVQRKIQLWDVANHRHLRQIVSGVDNDLQMTLSPDGRWLATTTEATARVWDLKDGQPITEELIHQYWVKCPVFSPDGRLLATCGGDALARVWELPSGRERLAIAHATQVYRAAFSPDGTRLATGDFDGRIRVWSPVTGQPLSPELNLDSRVTTLTFSPDGRCLLAGTFRGIIQVWDAATGDKLGPPWNMNSTVQQTAFRADGRQLLLQAGNHAPQLWDFTGDERSPEDWSLLAMVEAGCRIDPAGAVTRLTPREVRETWDELRRRAPAETTVAREQVRSWYQHQDIRLRFDKLNADAVTLLNRAVADFPEDLDLLYSRGLNAGFAKQFDLGLADLRRVARHRPAAWRDVVWLYEEARRRPQGLARLTEELTRDAGNGELLGARGWLYYKDRQWEPAISDLTAAIERGADDGGSLVFCRGYAHAELGQWAAACDDLGAAVEKQADIVSRHYYRAMALLAVNDLDRFKEVVGPAGMARLARAVQDSESAFYAAWTAALTPYGDQTQALQLIERALRDESRRQVYLNAYGLILYRLGRYKEAVEKIQASMTGENSKGNIWDWLILALAYQKQNQSDEARHWFAQAETWMAQPRDKWLKVGNTMPLEWSDRVEVELLHREAAALLKP